MSIAPGVKLLVERNLETLTEAGYALDDFAGASVSKAKEVIAEARAALGLTDDAPLGNKPPQTGTTTPSGDGSVELVTYMGLDVEKRTYGEGRERRVYQNAKAFEGAAYMNISLPTPDGKHLKLGAVNLQDLSEAQAIDNGTRRGRAMLLNLLKTHGLNQCSTIKFEVELNVQALNEDTSAELEEAIANFFPAK